jgi:NADH:ubiquinone oxidoreductase subunit 4 (subunit M)
MLHMAARVIWGPLKLPEHEVDKDNGQEMHLPTDLSLREMTVLVPLAIVVFALGVMPNVVLKSILAPVHAIQPSETRTALDGPRELLLSLTLSPAYRGEGKRQEAK